MKPPSPVPKLYNKLKVCCDVHAPANNKRCCAISLQCGHGQQVPLVIQGKFAGPTTSGKIKEHTTVATCFVCPIIRLICAVVQMSTSTQPAAPPGGPPTAPHVIWFAYQPLFLCTVLKIIVFLKDANP